ncbi:sulfatase-like hydrolase/transferase [Rubritalea tangerina]|uniref:sulfatase-like hydrolase/transferase n=1 Tax=Rubritalea tangerina TaxID=430798 RepID=UPI0036075BF4
MLELGQYKETDWGGLDATDQEFGGDFLVSNWISKHLKKQHDKPFFLACGIYRPHEPWFVPQKYFDKFPLESIKLPLGYKKNDLDDLTSIWQKNGTEPLLQAHPRPQAMETSIQGYLASINFADAMLGRVLDALESGRIKTTPLWFFGQITDGISEKNNIGKNTPDGVPLLACRS